MIQSRDSQDACDYDDITWPSGDIKRKDLDFWRFDSS